MKQLIISFFVFFSIGLYCQEYSSEEFNEFFYQGRLIKEVRLNDITVSSSLRQVQRNDGKYYTFDVSVTNNTDRDVTLFTNKISAMIFAPNGKKSIRVPALTRKEYLKIKKNRQNMRAGLMAFAGGMSAASAGQSSSTTTTNAYGSYSGTANTNASAYGSGGYAYGNATTNYRETLMEQQPQPHILMMALLLCGFSKRNLKMFLQRHLKKLKSDGTKNILRTTPWFQK